MTLDKRVSNLLGHGVDMRLTEGGMLWLYTVSEVKGSSSAREDV